jgi:hypothetical protein
MRKRTILIGYSILVVWAALPLLVSLLADTLAHRLGAHTTCGGNYLGPCVIFGADICPLLNTMGAMVWLFFLTFPTGVFAIVLFTVVVVVLKLRERRRRAQERQPPTGGDGKPAP